MKRYALFSQKVSVQDLFAAFISGFILKKQRSVLLQVLDNSDMNHLDLEWADRS